MIRVLSANIHKNFLTKTKKIAVSQKKRKKKSLLYNQRKECAHVLRSV